MWDEPRGVVPAAIRRALALRDKGCTHPGCTRPHHWCDSHHIIHWAIGGPTSLDNLVLLCRRTPPDGPRGCREATPVTAGPSGITTLGGHAFRCRLRRPTGTGPGPDGGRAIDALLLSVGADLPYFTGYRAMPLERLTMLVLPGDGPATLVVPALEAPRVAPCPEAFTVEPWEETEDPVAAVARLCGPAAAPGRGRHHLGGVPAGPAGAAARSLLRSPPRP